MNRSAPSFSRSSPSHPAKAQDVGKQALRVRGQRQLRFSAGLAGAAALKLHAPHHENAAW